jgi:hypothetical protein
MSETADRWWVRVAARWLARIDGVSGQLRLAMLVMTGLSTATVALQNAGLQQFALPLIGVTGVGLAAFAYVYTEGGVWNQMARDRADMSSNYATPQARISTEMTAAALLAALEGRPPTDSEREAIEDAARERFDAYRDGVELDREVADD